MYHHEKMTEFSIQLYVKEQKALKRKEIHKAASGNCPTIFIVLEDKTVLAVFAVKNPCQKEDFIKDEEFFVATLVYNGELKKDCKVKHIEKLSFDGTLGDEDQDILGVSAFFTISGDGKLQFSTLFFKEIEEFEFTGDLRQLHPNQENKTKYPIQRLIIGHW